MSLHFTQDTPAPANVSAYPASNRHQPKTNMGMAACSLLGTWPLAIVAIIYASSAKTKTLAGDKNGANKAAARAKGWAIASWCVAAVLLIFILSAG